MLFALALVVVFLFRIFWAMKVDFFIDEGYSGLMINHGMGDIVHKMAADYNTFFHYIYIKWWSVLFGDSHMMLRLSSLFVSALCVYVFYKLTKFLFKTTGMRQAVTILYAAIPCVLYYSFEVRTYAMESLWVFISLYYIFKAYTEKPSKRDVWVFAGVLIAGFYTHMLFSVHIFLIGLYCLCHLKHTHLRKYIVSTVVAGLSMLYWLPHLLVQAHDKATDGWLPFLYFKSVFYDQRSLFLFPLSYNGNSWWITGTVLFVSIAALIGLAWAKKKEARLILYIILGTQTVFFLVSMSVVPIYFYRYLSYLTPLYILGFGVFLERLGWLKDKWKISILGLLTLICLYITSSPYNVTLNVRTIQPYLEEYHNQGYTIVFEDAFTYLPGTYYLNQKNIRGTRIYIAEEKLKNYFGKVMIPKEAYLPELDPKGKYVLVRDYFYEFNTYKIRPEDEVMEKDGMKLIIIE